MIQQKTTYRIVAVYFPAGKRGRYDMKRLRRVYQRSADAMGVTAEVVRIDTPKLQAASRFMDDNTAKLHVWRQMVEQATEPLILTDADMMFTGSDFAAAFEQTFDVAFTQRTGQVPRYPINGGVVFVRPTDAARQFMARWCAANDRMVRDARFHAQWKAHYGGLNQAALGYMIETGRMDCDYRMLPCATWNAVEEDWPTAMQEGARLVHVKGKLRGACLSPHDHRRQHTPWPDLVAKWLEYDQCGS